MDKKYYPGDIVYIIEKKHYGYRYGRWYYGDGHRYECQNGNGNYG